LLTVAVVGAGFAGSAAALSARKAGAEAIILERTDMVGGVGLLAGLLLANGSLTGALEAHALGGGELFQACESVTIHRIDYLERFDLSHATIFDVLRIEKAIREVLDQAGIKLKLRARVKDVRMKANRIWELILDDGTPIRADAFVDATGATGGVAECSRYGAGCVMCVLRCPSFGGRVSISAKAGAKDVKAVRADGSAGTLNRSINLVKGSLAPSLRANLNKSGYLLIPLAEERSDPARASAREGKGASPMYFRMVDNGYAKLSCPKPLSLVALRAIPGLENARLADPLSGGAGNMVRNLAFAPRDNNMKVNGVDNLFCAGDKAGPKRELAPVIISGLLAGHNAVRYLLARDLIELPRTTAAGDFFAFEKERMSTDRELKKGYGFESGEYFERMRSLGLYTTDAKEVNARIEKAGLRDILAEKLV
jgi:hypothetical protein